MEISGKGTFNKDKRFNMYQEAVMVPMGDWAKARLKNLSQTDKVRDPSKVGSGFGKNVTQRECVVTGGLGTIEVTHNGKTYYVCCTGCRDYFNENAEKVLADHAARTKSK